MPQDSTTFTMRVEEIEPFYGGAPQKVICSAGDFPEDNGSWRRLLHVGKNKDGKEIEIWITIPTLYDFLLTLNSDTGESPAVAKESLLRTVRSCCEISKKEEEEVWESLSCQIADAASHVLHSANGSGWSEEDLAELISKPGEEPEEEEPPLLKKAKIFLSRVSRPRIDLFRIRPIPVSPSFSSRHVVHSRNREYRSPSRRSSSASSSGSGGGGDGGDDSGGSDPEPPASFVVPFPCNILSQNTHHAMGHGSQEGGRC